MELKNVGRFVLTDSTLDSHSERILVDGVDLKRFKANPIMFYNHLTSSKVTFEKGKVLPIGRWENIKKENGQVVADALIDMDDEFSAKVANKVEKKIITSASIGLSVKAVSDDVADKVKGQVGVTITKCELLECSLVDVPSNPNARIVSKIYAEKSKQGKSIDFDNTVIIKSASLNTKVDKFASMGATEYLKIKEKKDKQKIRQKLYGKTIGDLIAEDVAKRK